MYLREAEITWIGLGRLESDLLFLFFKKATQPVNKRNNKFKLYLDDSRIVNIDIKKHAQIKISIRWSCLIQISGVLNTSLKNLTW